MASQKAIEDAIKSLSELEGDVTVPRNIKIKIQDIIQILNDNSETSIKISKALNELDEIANDPNIQPYTRTNIWNVVSLLESVLAK